MPYALLKVLHILAVVLFLGNIFTGIYWMSIAMKTRDIRIVHHTIKGVMKSDRLFTIPGVILITVGGIFTAAKGGIPVFKTGWILWSIIMFTLSGIAFGWKIAPLQKKLSKLSEHQEALSEPAWKTLKDTYWSWEMWGLFALITPLLALIMMTMKHPA